MVRVLPPGASRDAGLLLETRGVRAFADGLISVVLAAYLGAVGLSDVRIGIVVTLTLLGSAALTLVVGLRAHAYPRRRLLQFVSLLMVATGLGFAAFSSFWPIALVGLVGTLNPSGGDVSVFLPTEQALLPSTVAGRATHRPLRPLHAHRGARRRLRRAVRRCPRADRRAARRVADDVAAVGLRRLRRARRGRARPGTAASPRPSSGVGDPPRACPRASRGGPCTGWPRCSASTPSAAASSSRRCSCCGCSGASGSRSP